MNKTVSLSIRILAILGAIGAGTAWYLIHTNNLKVAMDQSAWLLDDPEVKSGKEFVQRMDALPKVKTLLGEKRKEIDQLKNDKQGLEATVESKNKAIAAKNTHIEELEGRNATLIRTRDSLNTDVQRATARNAQLQSELDRFTAEVARKNEQIANMFSKERLDEQIKATEDAISKQEKAFAGYARLLNWTKTQGLNPPFPSSPDAQTVEAGSPIPTFVPPTIKTEILALDPKNGVISISLGFDDQVSNKQTYTVTSNGVEIGSIQLSDVRVGASVALLLPGTDVSKFVPGSIILLTQKTAQPVIVPVTENTVAVAK